MSLSRQAKITAHAAIDIIASRPVPGPDVRDIAAWRRSVRNALRGTHWPAVMAALEADPSMTVAALVAHLDPEAIPEPSEPPEPIAAREWADNAHRQAEYAATDVDVEHAKARIASIRVELRTVTKATQEAIR